MDGIKSSTASRIRKWEKCHQEPHSETGCRLHSSLRVLDYGRRTCSIFWNNIEKAQPIFKGNTLFSSSISRREPTRRRQFDSNIFIRIDFYIEHSIDLRCVQSLFAQTIAGAKKKTLANAEQTDAKKMKMESKQNASYDKYLIFFSLIEHYLNSRDGRQILQTFLLELCWSPEVWNSVGFWA